MMDVQLTTISLLERAEKYFAKKTVVSRTSSGIQRFTYQQIGERTRRLSSVLENMGVSRGDMVGTIGWNHHWHLEAYFAIPNMGAVLHTINFRLSDEHLIYIINNAKDKVLLVDKDFLPIIERVKDKIPTVESIIVMTNEEELPNTALSSLYLYEKLIRNGEPNYQYPTDIKESEPAGICYTSATTGNPKGVLYSHRSMVLHSMAQSMTDGVGISEEDTALVIVPMFHVNAWGLPFTAAMLGTTQVLPGPNFTPKILLELIQSEKVTLTAAVPTVLLGILNELESNPYDTSSLRMIVNGGSAAPKSMIRDYEMKHKIPFYQGYGMTETSPFVSITRLKSYQQDLPYESKLDLKAKQGIMITGVEAKIIDENGEVQWDGTSMGELLLRGPWITDSYYRETEKTKEAIVDGWLHTGDVATIDEEGFVKLVDRTKDLVKSGGEWISSVDLENAIMSHEAVAEAAVVGLPHPKWQERPIAVVVLKEKFKNKVTKEDIIEFIKPQFAKWWIPDDVILMDEIPKTSVGKFLKRALREKLESFFVVK
ncbi:long-chain fatty acid--CoA ligase [Neobacillus niacini]|uniref:long-chain fatty acid--CoA ligase n=1 Tax=Neobacillus niacini TaxID=86668 RepID=UPI0021CB8D01|nr:long-chain fatty acid--CoA ligase [Neobacillus niacini]MCM3767730.1 long-chain fatty acid--CoA ligase [Neobacillus niacini]